MFKLIGAIHRAMMSMFPVIEALFLSIYIGSFFGAATTVVFGIILLICTYFFHLFMFPFAWGILGYILVKNHGETSDAVFAAILLAGIRILVHYGFRWIRR